MDLSKLTTADKLIVGGGLGYLIFMFLNWYSWQESTEVLGETISSPKISATGWDYFIGGILPLILILVMVAHVLITRFSPSTQLPELPLPWSRIHLIAGAAAAAIVLLRLIIPAEIEFGGIETGQDFDRAIGIFLALVAALVVAYGGFLKSKEPEAPAAPGGTGTAPF